MKRIKMVSLREAINMIEDNCKWLDFIGTKQYGSDGIKVVSFINAKTGKKMFVCLEQKNDVVDILNFINKISFEHNNRQFQKESQEIEFNNCRFYGKNKGYTELPNEPLRCQDISDKTNMGLFCAAESIMYHCDWLTDAIISAPEFKNEKGTIRFLNNDTNNFVVKYGCEFDSVLDFILFQKNEHNKNEQRPKESRRYDLGFKDGINHCINKLMLEKKEAK